MAKIVGYSNTPAPSHVVAWCAVAGVAVGIFVATLTLRPARA